MQIKTKVKYHFFHFIRGPKFNHILCWGACEKTSTLKHYWGGGGGTQNCITSTEGTFSTSSKNTYAFTFWISIPKCMKHMALQSIFVWPSNPTFRNLLWRYTSKYMNKQTKSQTYTQGYSLQKNLQNTVNTLNAHTQDWLNKLWYIFTVEY